MDPTPKPNLEAQELQLPTLDKVDIMPPLIPEHAKPPREMETVHAIFNGMEANLEMVKIASGRHTSIQMNVSIGSIPDAANLIITFNLNKSLTEYIGNTNIENKRREMKGLGRALWLMSLRTMQRFSSESGKPVRHIVTKFPSEGLSDEKWDELFLPLLEKHRYTKLQTDDPTWQKVYLP